MFIESNDPDLPFLLLFFIKQKMIVEHGRVPSEAT